MLRAIETVHNGYKFRSRLEARWAVLFDELGIRYTYEPEGFDLDSVWYLPDFWLPDYGCWIEIKPAKPTDEEIMKCQKLAIASGQPVYLLYGDVWYDLDPQYENGILFDNQGRFYSHFYWMRCVNCGKLGIGNKEVIPFSDGTNGTVAIGRCDCEEYRGEVTPDIQAAYAAARQARFDDRPLAA